MNRLSVWIFSHNLLHVKCRNLYNRTGNYDRCSGLCSVSLKLLLKSLFCYAALVISVLSLVHCKFKEFLIILTSVPTFLFHHLNVTRQIIRECILWNAGVELKSLLLNNLLNLRSKFARKFTHLTKNHVHCILVYGLPSWLTLKHVHQVHKGGVLYILAERSYQWRITQSWPYVLNLLEEHNYQVINAEFLLALISE